MYKRGHAIIDVVLISDCDEEDAEPVQSISVPDLAIVRICCPGIHKRDNRPYQPGNEEKGEEDDAGPVWIATESVADVFGEHGDGEEVGQEGAEVVTEGGAGVWFGGGDDNIHDQAHKS